MNRLMLDLCAGLGGASAAMRDRGWQVVTVDNDPAFGCTITADLTDWRWTGERPYLVWASPPCNEFSRDSMPWTKPRPLWEKCKCCENYWCNTHSQHAHDCPCPPIEEWETDPYSARKPSMALVEAALRIIRECQPTYWVLENVRGAIPWLTPLLGKYRQSHGPFFLWGSYPPFRCRVRGFKERLSSAARAARAKVPYRLSEALAKACEQSLWPATTE